MRSARCLTLDGTRPQDLYFKYRAAVAYIVVDTPVGDQAIGTAFHIGDNVWVTARHVVAGNRIRAIATTGNSIAAYSATLEAQGGVLFGHQSSMSGAYRLASDPMMHPDESVDVAILRLEGPMSTLGDEMKPWPGDHPPTPVVQLGGWLDDWLGDELMLEPVLVMGYPPIPFGREPLLVATTAEVNAVLDKRGGGHPHFILSAMARGGFSGALAMTSFEAALGVTTESLIMDSNPAELGYFAVLSVEPIYVCLDHHGVLPAAQRLHDP